MKKIPWHGGLNDSDSKGGASHIMAEKRLKDDIKELKYWIRVYKKELKEARKHEEWSAIDFMDDRIKSFEHRLDELMKQYKKE